MIGRSGPHGFRPGRAYWTPNLISEVAYHQPYLLLLRSEIAIDCYVGDSGRLSAVRETVHDWVG